MPESPSTNLNYYEETVKLDEMQAPDLSSRSSVNKNGSPSAPRHSAADDSSHNSKSTQPVDCPNINRHDSFSDAYQYF